MVLLQAIPLFLILSELIWDSGVAFSMCLNVFTQGLGGLTLRLCSGLMLNEWFARVVMQKTHKEVCKWNKGQRNKIV